MVGPRDYSAMGRLGGCAVCGFMFAPELVATEHWSGFSAHVALHLADGTAVVEKAFGKPDRVVPTFSLPVKDTADDPTPPKPKTLPRNARPFYGKSFRP